MSHRIVRAVFAASVLVLAGSLAPVPLRAEVIATDESKAPPPEIGGPSTRELAGLKIHYSYSTGREYELSFDADTVTFMPFKMPGEAPGTKYQPGTLHYLARRIRPQLYMVHWLVRSPTMGNIHVTLLVDLKERHVHVSALMPGAQEFFDIADIQTISWKKPGR